MNPTILFVDDEEEIRDSFNQFFDSYFSIVLAENGLEALAIIGQQKQIEAVVTDLRMPEIDGLELIQKGRDINPDLGFIIVSGHGDVPDIIRGMRLGARNYLHKPYNFVELKESIDREIKWYRSILEDRAQKEKIKNMDIFVTSIGHLAYQLPTRTDLINPISFRLAQILEGVGLIPKKDESNAAIALMELITNAMEHGNMEITREEKIILKENNTYQQELAKRENTEPYSGRSVFVFSKFDHLKAVIQILDEGSGFDYENLPDPTELGNSLLPSGRGILIARSIVSEIEFKNRGNIVRIEFEKRRRT